MKIHIAAAAILREDGATLLVRKRGTSIFMQPGGKIDEDEEPVSALRRELYEELGLAINPDDTEYLGRFSAPAANEADCLVTAELFRLLVNVGITAQAEIEEALWVQPGSQAMLNLAPLTRDIVLPTIWG